MNASIKSGTNQIHGDLWEYFRNTNLDATNWNALMIPPYHENQFGATLGFPIMKNKLFYFGDAEANRISIELDERLYRAYAPDAARQFFRIAEYQA